MLQKRGTAIDRVLNFVVPDSVLVRAACAAVSLGGACLPSYRGLGACLLHLVATHWR